MEEEQEEQEEEDCNDCLGGLEILRDFMSLNLFAASVFPGLLTILLKILQRRIQISNTFSSSRAK